MTPTLTGSSYSCVLPVRHTKKPQTLTLGFLRGPQKTASMVITTPLLVGCQPSEPSSPEGFYGREKQEEGWGSARHREGKHTMLIITLPPIAMPDIANQSLFS